MTVSESDSTTRFWLTKKKNYEVLEHQITTKLHAKSNPQELQPHLIESSKQGEDQVADAMTLPSSFAPKPHDPSLAHAASTLNSMQSHTSTPCIWLLKICLMALSVKNRMT